MRKDAPVKALEQEVATANAQVVEAQESKNRLEGFAEGVAHALEVVKKLPAHTNVSKTPKAAPKTATKGA